MRREELKKYMSIKKVGYIYNLLECDAKKKNDTEALESYKTQQEVFLSQLDENSAKIYLNTYYFPYDMALCKYLHGNKLTDEMISEGVSKFGIDSKLMLDKMKEYIKYSYLELLEYDYDSKLTELAKMIDNGWSNIDKLEVNNNENAQK